MVRYSFSLHSTFLQTHNFDGLMTSHVIPPNAKYMTFSRRGSRNEDRSDQKEVHYYYASSQARRDKSLRMEISAMVSPSCSSSCCHPVETHMQMQSLPQGSQSTVMLESSPAVMRAQLTSEFYVPSPASSESYIPSAVHSQGKFPQMSFDGHHSQLSNPVVRDLDRRQPQQAQVFRRPPQSRLARPSKTYPEFRVPPLNRPLVLGAIKARPQEERGTLEQVRKRLDSLSTVIGFLQADDQQPQ